MEEKKGEKEQRISNVMLSIVFVSSNGKYSTLLSQGIMWGPVEQRISVF